MVSAPRWIPAVPVVLSLDLSPSGLPLERVDAFDPVLAENIVRPVADMTVAGSHRVELFAGGNGANRPRVVVEAGDGSDVKGPALVLHGLPACPGARLDPIEEVDGIGRKERDEAGCSGEDPSIEFVTDIGEALDGGMKSRPNDSDEIPAPCQLDGRIGIDMFPKPALEVQAQCCVCRCVVTDVGANLVERIDHALL
jgi:hypothetical protein